MTSTDPLGTRNVSQCRCDKRRIVFRQRRFEICSHVFVGFQVFRGILLFRSRLCHALSYNLRARSIATLMSRACVRLSPAGQQDYHRLSTLDEVNATSRSVIDPQLRNAFSDRLKRPPD
jgi:hypothetical protein